MVNTNSKHNLRLNIGSRGDWLKEDFAFESLFRPPQQMECSLLIGGAQIVIGFAALAVAMTASPIYELTEPSRRMTVSHVIRSRWAPPAFLKSVMSRADRRPATRPAARS